MSWTTCGHVTGCWSCCTAGSRSSSRVAGQTVTWLRRPKELDQNMTDDSSVAVKSAQPGPGGQPAVHPRRRSSVLRIARLRDLALIPAILVIGAIGVYVSPVFLTRQNLTNVLQQQSEISLVVLGEAMILIAGWLVLPKVPGHGQGLQLAGAWSIPIALAVGVLIGLLNGLLIVRFQLNG